jgi:hypothetical protein
VGFLFFNINAGPAQRNLAKRQNKRRKIEEVKTTTNLTTKFARKTRFEVNPLTSVPFRTAQDTDLEQLKARLLRQILAGDVTADLNVRLRRAANEAAALAWLEPYPLLVFPSLLEEKAVVAKKQVAKQRKVYQRSRRLLDAAATPTPDLPGFVEGFQGEVDNRDCAKLF